MATEGKLYDSTSGDGLEPLFRERPLGGNAIAFLGDVPDAAMSPQVEPSGMSKEEEEDWENYKWKEREAAEEERKRREAENEIRRENERRAERERVRRAGLTPEQRKAEDEYIEKLREATLARERAERRCDEDYHLAMQTAHSEWWSCSTECWENFLLCVAADVAARVELWDISSASPTSTNVEASATTTMNGQKSWRKRRATRARKGPRRISRFRSHHQL